MAVNYLDKTGLALLWEKIKNVSNGKVDKIDGKGLSSNDYTSDEKTKLANIQNGAQSNIIEGVQRNGVSVPLVNKIANISVPTATSDLTNDSGYVTLSDIESSLATVMDYKGTVAKVEDLPMSGNKSGDVYHVAENDMEYAWIGSGWEELGGLVDLSGYVQKSELVAITSSEINTICV